MPAPLQGIVVVLVEDHSDTLELLRVTMEHRGALVIPVSDAKSALETLGRVKPDVLVSDMNMPEGDGWWLMSEASTQGLLNGVPALAVTALTMTPQEVHEAGFDAYLRKPVDPSVLCEAVYGLARPGTQPSV